MYEVACELVKLRDFVVVLTITSKLQSFNRKTLQLLIGLSRTIAEDHQGIRKST